MKKKEIIMMLSVGIIFFIAMCILFQHSRIIYSNDCLKEIAEDYCIGNNMTFHKFDKPYGYFYCNLNHNPRIEFKPLLKKFFFLDSEMDNCIIKEHWSWRVK